MCNQEAHFDECHIYKNILSLYSIGECLSVKIEPLKKFPAIIILLCYLFIFFMLATVLRDSPNISFKLVCKVNRKCFRYEISNHKCYKDKNVM